jgi:ribosomal protein RSM22 (predicted rRNA methylase)
MSWYRIYRFPFLAAVTWLIFTLFLFVNFKQSNVVFVARKDIHIQKRNSGTYGKFSFTLNVSYHQNNYSRSFKNYCISNLFLDFKNIEKVDSVYLSISTNQLMDKSQNKKLYYLANHKLNLFEEMIQIVAYSISNQILYLVIPLILTFILCADEYKKDYRYFNNLHKKLSNIAFTLIGIFILLIAIY